MVMERSLISIEASLLRALLAGTSSFLSTGQSARLMTTLSFTSQHSRDAGLPSGVKSLKYSVVTGSPNSETGPFLKGIMATTPGLDGNWPGVHTPNGPVSLVQGS